ncbi:MAG: hypothetical protein R6V26_07350 [Roseovarius sp.]
MHRIIIALVIGSAIAITTPDATLAAPRDREETAAAAGVAVLAIVAAAIAVKRRQHERNETLRDRHDVPKASPEHLSLRGPVGRGHDAGDRGANRIRVPDACRVLSDQRAGYSGRCLQRHRYDQAALPSACAVRVGGHHRTIYRDRCLNGYGYE